MKKAIKKAKYQDYIAQVDDWRLKMILSSRMILYAMSLAVVSSCGSSNALYDNSGRANIDSTSASSKQQAADPGRDIDASSNSIPIDSSISGEDVIVAETENASIPVMVIGSFLTGCQMDEQTARKFNCFVASNEGEVKIPDNFPVRWQVLDESDSDISFRVLEGSSDLGLIGSKKTSLLFKEQPLESWNIVASSLEIPSSTATAPKVSIATLLQPSEPLVTNEPVVTNEPLANYEPTNLTELCIEKSDYEAGPPRSLSTQADFGLLGQYTLKIGGNIAFENKALEARLVLKNVDPSTISVKLVSPTSSTEYVRPESSTTISSGISMMFRFPAPPSLTFPGRWTIEIMNSSFESNGLASILFFELLNPGLIGMGCKSTM